MTKSQTLRSETVQILAMATSYNWLFQWDYAFYKWGFVSTITDNCSFWAKHAVVSISGPTTNMLNCSMAMPDRSLSHSGQTIATSKDIASIYHGHFKHE